MDGTGAIDRAVEACTRKGGVARTAELRGDGVSRRALAAAVAANAIIRPRQGVYALPSTSVAAIEALAHRGMIACVTAAREHGLWVLDDGEDEPVHTWVDGDRHPATVADCACVHHRDLPVERPSLWLVGVLHCLVQVAWCRGEEAFFTALESALRQGLISSSGWRRIRAAVPVPLKWLLDLARTDADSGLESLLRLRLHRIGVSLRTQVELAGVGIVDFVIGDCLVLEADGRSHDGDGRHRDLLRDALAATLGFTTLRFDYALIVHEWPIVESAILAALAQQRHRSAAGLRWEDAEILPLLP